MACVALLLSEHRTEDGIRTRLQEHIQLLTLVADVIRVHTKLITTGDTLTWQNFQSVLGNRYIGKQVVASLRLPTFVALDVYTLQIESLYKDRAIPTIHEYLSIRGISELFHVVPGVAPHFQAVMYCRLLQRALQQKHLQVEDVRLAVLAIFSAFDPKAADAAAAAAGGGAREDPDAANVPDDEDQDVFLAVFGGGSGGAGVHGVHGVPGVTPPPTVDWHDPLHDTTRQAVEDSRPARR
jgi:hypothetical protein